MLHLKQKFDFKTGGASIEVYVDNKEIIVNQRSFRSYVNDKKELIHKFLEHIEKSIKDIKTFIDNIKVVTYNKDDIQLAIKKLNVYKDNLLNELKKV